MKIESTPVPNRVTSHASPPLIVPDTPEARQTQYSRALAAAVAFLESRITSGDVEAAERAVTMLFDLEKTRLRHDRAIHGVPEPKAKPTTAMLPPMEMPSPVVRSLRDRIDDVPEEKHFPVSSDSSVSSSPSGHGVTGPQKTSTPVVRSLRDRIDDATEEKDSRSADDAPTPSSPSGHGVTGPQKRTRSILLRRLAEVDPGRVWSDVEIERMLTQLEVLYREQTGHRG